MRGFSKTNEILRSLFLTRLYIWPRFHYRYVHTHTHTNSLMSIYVLPTVPLYICLVSLISLSFSVCAVVAAAAVVVVATAGADDGSTGGTVVESLQHLSVSALAWSSCFNL